jgi:hypothetical protein
MEDGGRVDYAVDRREVIFRWRRSVRCLDSTREWSEWLTLMFIAVYGVVRTARVLEVVSRRHDELDGWRRGTEEDARVHGLN